MIKDGIATARIKNRLSAIRGYWKWLISRGHLEPEAKLIWEDHELPKSTTERRKIFSDDDLVKIFKRLKEVAGEGDQAVYDVARVGLFTGMRIEEICQIKLEYVYDDYFEIPEAKTEAGVRIVTIHKDLKPVFDKLKKNTKSGYILDGLSSNNKYESRSGAVDKRVNKILHHLGFTSRVQKFHSLRGTLAGKFKAAGVPEATAADCIGHSITTMTYGLYAGIIDIEPMKEAMDKVKYPERVMKHFRE